MAHIVAIVGRPNVGKSTLFNRLIGERKALVHDRPGVTRDRIYGICRWGGRDLVIIDTGGFEPDPRTDLFGAMRSQVMLAIQESAVVVMVVDRKTGLHPLDEQVASVLRSSQKPVIIVVNKVDDQVHEGEAGEFYKLAPKGDLVLVSAEHGRGISTLVATISEALPKPDLREEIREEDEQGEELVEPEQLDDLADFADNGEDDPFTGELPESQDQEEPWPDDPSLDELEAQAVRPPPRVDSKTAPASREVRISILGRPNVGKSTLANRLIGEDRHLVHDAPGTTMDAIDSPFTFQGRPYRLIDTAGIRRRSRIDDRLEVLAVSMAIRTIERCHITLYVIDGTLPPATQDSRLASLAAERGRGLIFLVNRWDLVRKETARSAEQVEEEIRDTFPLLTWAPILFISALTGKGCARILPLVDRVYAEFNRRIPTAELNGFLRALEESTPPPQSHHHPVRIHFATQARVRPPTLVLFSNTPEAIKVPYRRFIENQLRKRFGFNGSPIRLSLRRKRKPGEPK